MGDMGGILAALPAYILSGLSGRSGLVRRCSFPGNGIVASYVAKTREMGIPEVEAWRRLEELRCGMWLKHALDIHFRNIKAKVVSFRDTLCTHESI